MDEVIFLVEQVRKGGYIAKAQGEPLIAEANSIFELNKMIRDAVAGHFDKDKLPKIKIEFSKN